MVNMFGFLKFRCTIPSSIKITNTIIRQVGNFKRPQINVLRNEGLTALKNTLQESKPLSPTEWRNLRQKIITCERNINEINIDAVILGHCDSYSNLDFAKNYISFLRNEGIEPNYATLGRLMKLYYTSYKNGTLSEIDRKDVLDFYNNLRKKHDLIDPTTCENLICALVITSEWKKALELLDMIKKLGTPSIYAYGLIIEKCFENMSDSKLGWQLLNEMVAMGKQPQCNVFIAYFRGIKNDCLNFHNDLEKMLEFIGDNDILVSTIVVNELCNILKEMGIKSHPTIVSDNGKCQNCGLNMKDIVISSKEFDELRSSFLNQVLIRKDAFLKTTPDEVKEFLEYVDKTIPYDCVIDGLNVAFSAGTKKPSIVFAKLLASIVQYFTENDMKILVIGRKHMNKWPKEQMNYIKKKSNLFLTSNLSNDDPFMLYATLKSGINTNFFSRDLMRSHAFLLNGNLRSVFRRWQQIHQYSLIYATDYGKVTIKKPTKYHINAHKVDRTWHIPFKAEYSATPGNSYNLPEKWLCFRI